MNNYDYMFRWIKNATKPERHIDEMETFAKKHPMIFMKFHKESENDVTMVYKKVTNADATLIELFIIAGTIDSATFSTPFSANS